MNLAFLYKNPIILSLLKIVTLKFTMYILLILTYSLPNSALKWFEKLILKKSDSTLNGNISKTRRNLESRLRFSKSSFNFVENIVIFCAFYPRGYTAAVFSPYNPRIHCQWLAGRKGLKVQPCKIYNNRYKKKLLTRKKQPNFKRHDQFVR